VRSHLRYTFVMASTCACVALSAASQVRLMSPQAIVSDVWSGFAETCVPFIVNPQKALLDGLNGDLGNQKLKTPDDTVFHLHTDFFQSSDRIRKAVGHLGATPGMISCEVYRHEAAQPFRAQALGGALRQMTSQLPRVALAGEEMILSEFSGARTGLTNDYNSDGGFGTYFIDIALPGRHGFIPAELDEGVFGRYVSATILREDRR
jgi:hypothetical protein